MKTKTLIRPAIQTMEGVPSHDVTGVSPISSAMVGATLVGDLEDVLAVLRTTVLLARSLKAPLSLHLFEKDVLSGQMGETPYSTLVSELLDSVRVQLRGLDATAFAMEVNVVAASFVCAGSVMMSVHSANPVLKP